MPVPRRPRSAACRRRRAAASGSVAPRGGVGGAEAVPAPPEIGCLSPSASGSVEVDRAEARGVAAALGERAAELPVTAIKAMLGEGLGVSAAWQAVELVETLRDGVLPGIAGLEQLEPGLPLPLPWLGAAGAAGTTGAPAA